MDRLGKEIPSDEWFDYALGWELALRLLVWPVDVDGGLVVEPVVVEAECEVVQDCLVGGIDL